jgi:hypothetical protein
MKVLLTLANESFLVSPETAQKVQSVLPADKTVTVTQVKDVPDHPLLGQKQKPSLFEQAQQREHPMTERQQELAQRLAKHMTKSQPKPK